MKDRGGASPASVENAFVETRGPMWSFFPAQPSQNEGACPTGSRQNPRALCWDLSSLFEREGSALGAYGGSIFPTPLGLPIH